MRRPVDLDVRLLENHRVYASHALLGGHWVGALFASVDLREGDLLCEYTGKLLEKHEEATSSSEYLMKVRDPLDLRRRRVIDGDPRSFGNLAGYANHSEHKLANARFVDQTRRHGRSQVVLLAKEFIPGGTEIRVDYDMGSHVYPFRDMMIARGTYDASPDYKRTSWEFPQVVSAAALGWKRGRGGWGSVPAAPQVVPGASHEAAHRSF